jgi:hypothetical protein
MSSHLIFQGKMTLKETVNCISSSKNRIGSDRINCDTVLLPDSRSFTLILTLESTVQWQIAPHGMEAVAFLGMALSSSLQEERRILGLVSHCLRQAATNDWRKNGTTMRSGVEDPIRCVCHRFSRKPPRRVGRDP